MWKGDLSCAEGMRLVKAARPQARPNVGFLHQLHAWHGVARGVALEDDDGARPTTRNAANGCRVAVVDCGDSGRRATSSRTTVSRASLDWKTVALTLPMPDRYSATTSTAIAGRQGRSPAQTSSKTAACQQMPRLDLTIPYCFIKNQRDGRR